LSRDARELLRRHAWPGNIRELQNAVERALITCEGALVTAAHPATPLPPRAAPAPPAGVTRPGAAGSLHGAGWARAPGHHRRAPAYPWAQGARRRAPRHHAVSTLQPPEALPHRGVSRIARVADGASRHPPPFARASAHTDVRRCTTMCENHHPILSIESVHRIFRHFRRCDDLAASMHSPMSSPSEDSVMNRVLVVLTTITTILGTATAAGGQTAAARGERPVP